MDAVILSWNHNTPRNLVLILTFSSYKSLPHSSQDLSHIVSVQGRTRLGPYWNISFAKCLFTLDRSGTDPQFCSFWNLLPPDVSLPFSKNIPIVNVKSSLICYLSWSLNHISEKFVSFRFVTNPHVCRHCGPILFLFLLYHKLCAIKNVDKWALVAKKKHFTSWIEDSKSFFLLLCFTRRNCLLWLFKLRRFVCQKLIST